MAETGYQEVAEALRAAARATKEKFLVGIATASERTRVVAALAAEGEVVELPSSRAARERLAEEAFEVVVLSEDEDGDGDFWGEARELCPSANLVPLVEGSPARVAALLRVGVAAVLPRPLPTSDALVRAHLRYLASCRRARTRAAVLGRVIADHRAVLRAAEPGLEAALVALLETSRQAPAVVVVGDSELARVAGGGPSKGQADATVVALDAADRVELRLREARERSAGAAVIAVDNAATRERLCTAMYGGARAYVGRDFLPHLADLVAAVANRRRAELTGRQLSETLTRFGVMEGPPRPVLSPSLDLDASLIADATSGDSGAFVPSAHEVLVVDDEVVVLTVLRELLRRSGYRVTTAASAEEAVELMRKRNFDLVLTDKNLPGASGLEVLRVARGLDPAPAVVIITGYSSYDSAVSALEIGAQDYIEKPIRDAEALRFRIRRALSRRNEQLARSREAGKGEEQARIMVVEVDPSRRQLITEFLGRTHEVTGAANGEQALALLRQSRFDLVIADRNLPGMSGLRVIEQAQHLLPHCASVLYTAYPSYETVKEAFELGVDAYLVRPSQDLKLLADKVAGALRSHGGILLG